MTIERIEIASLGQAADVGFSGTFGRRRFIIIRKERRAVVGIIIIIIIMGIRSQVLLL